MYYFISFYIFYILVIYFQFFFLCLVFEGGYIFNFNLFSLFDGGFFFDSEMLFSSSMFLGFFYFVFFFRGVLLNFMLEFNRLVVFLRVMYFSYFFIFFFLKLVYIIVKFEFQFYERRIYSESDVYLCLMCGQVFFVYDNLVKYMVKYLLIEIIR